MNKSITVLGAGSVGVGTAMHLQQRGWAVTLVDRKQPGSETSYGNAGVINASSFIPLNNPGLYGKLPRLLLNNHAYLRFNLSHVLRNLPWMFHFLRLANKKSTLETADALGSLVEHALDEHKALMQRTGNMHRLSERGWLKLFRKGGGLDPDSLEGRLYAANNIATQSLSADEVRELEPSLAPIYKCGYLISDSASVNNPAALLREYVEQFVRDGGTMLERNVMSISGSNDNRDAKFIIRTENDSLECEKLVVCAGPWSGDVILPLGYRTRLGFERGYHQHFHLADGASLLRSIHDVESGFILGPMQQGARLTTGVELNHRDAASRLDQLHQVLPRVREAIALGEPTDDPIWRGCRPTFPDSRPVIDQAPAHDNLWLAFGHQHIGLMSGPVTGKLLAQKISGEEPDIDLSPFRASRWISR